METPEASTSSQSANSEPTLRSVNKNSIKKVLIGPYYCEVDYIDGKKETIFIPSAYDSSYIGWVFNSVGYYTGFSSPPVSGRSADWTTALQEMRDEFVATALVCSKDTFKVLEIAPKALSKAAFRGVEVNLELIIYSLEDIEDEISIDDSDFPRLTIKQKAPHAYQAVRLRADQIVFHDILLDPGKLERLLHPAGLIFLNIELYESTVSFFQDFFKNFAILACRARFIKADFKLTEENHGTTFKNCTKGIEEELANIGVRFIDLFDKVARVTIESAVTDKIRLVLLQNPQMDMIRIRMPYRDLEQNLSGEIFAEDNFDRSVYWPTTVEEATSG